MIKPQPDMKTARQLNLLDLTCLGINAIIGSSIFLFPGRLAGFLGPASILSFGLTGLFLICVGLCFAEASSYFDRAGGPYLYAEQAFGNWAGFGIGWMCWVTQIFSLAAVANAIAVYLGYFGSHFSGAGWIKGVAAGVIIAMGALNYRGVKLGAWTSNFFTAAKLIPLGLFVILGLPKIHLANYAPFAPHGWAPMGSACFLAYFAFQGFETVPVPSGEAKRPERNVPLAVIGAMVFATIAYMLIQAVAVGVHPGIAGSPKPLADAAAVIMGPAGVVLMVVGAVISTTGYSAGTALTSPRYLAALAEGSHLPAKLAEPHLKFATPHRSIMLTTVLTLAAAMVFDFNKLVDFSNVSVCVQYIATCAAVPFLRKSGIQPLGKFRLPGGWALPSIGIAATLWLGSQGGIAQIWWSVAILVFGFVLKVIFRSSRKF